MAQKYFYKFFLLVFFWTLSSNAQEGKIQPRTQQAAVIEGLNVYPNPVTNGKVYIATKIDTNKEIIIFDLLGKMVMQATINGRELNVSALSPGIYIIKINEMNATATRKLIIR